MIWAWLMAAGPSAKEKGEPERSPLERTLRACGGDGTTQILDPSLQMLEPGLEGRLVHHETDQLPLQLVKRVTHQPGRALELAANRTDELHEVLSGRIHPALFSKRPPQHWSCCRVCLRDQAKPKPSNNNPIPWLGLPPPSIPDRGETSA